MILIIDCGSSKTKEIPIILNESGFEQKKISIDDLPLKDYAGISGIIISGSSILLTNTPAYINRFDFIDKIKIPLFGICFGHQIIGLKFGSEVSKGNLIKGEQKMQILKENQLFKGIETNSNFDENHCEYINLPKDFELLAKSYSCDVEAMKHKEKNIYGVQFHPESSGENGKKMLINFCNLCL